MPRPHGAYDYSPLALSGYPFEITEQIRRDEMVAEMSQEPYVPIRAADIVANRRSLKVSFGDDTLNLTYKPSAINAVQEARENEQQAKGENLKAQANSLAEIIVSWDLLGDDDQPLPIALETIAPLGMDFTRKVTRAIIEDLRPNPTPPATSNSGS